MPLRDVVARELAAAAGGGLASTDVYVRLPAECARTSVALTHLLDAAERLSAAGLLAVPPPDPRVSAFRRWYLAEIHRQLSDGGRAAGSSWPFVAQASSTSAASAFLTGIEAP